MKFSIVVKTDQLFLSASNLIDNLSQELSLFLKEREYGSDIKEILVGCNIGYVPKGYEHLFKVKKPFYVDNKTIINKYTGESILLDKYYFYDFKISDVGLDEIVSVSDVEKNKIIVRELLKSFELMNNLPKKIKDFDLARFRTDLEDYFKDKGFI
jgi:hypothetical protein